MAKSNLTSIRFSDDSKRLLDALSQDTGLNMTAVIELAMRDLAKHRGVTVPVLERPSQTVREEFAA